MKTRWLLVFSLLLAHGCKESPSPKTGESSVAAPGVADQATDEDLIKLVQDAMVAGFTHHDLEGYLAIWSDDATLIAGRGPEAASTDRVFSRQQIAATKKLIFAGPTAGVAVIASDPKVVRKGEEAVLSWRMNNKQRDFAEVVDEVYKLRKTDAGWRVYENRYWLVETGTPEDLVKYTAAYWAAKDAAVSAAQSAGDKRAEITALNEAGRWGEAHTLSAELVSTSEDVEVWTAHLYLGVASGQTEDAKASACKIKALAPEAVLPAWAALHSCD
jgi:hypothetical protein